MSIEICKECDNQFDLDFGGGHIGDVPYCETCMPADQETRKDCNFYNFGGEIGNKERPTYPDVYGARCEKFNEFFSKRGSQLEPDCSNCVKWRTK